MMKQINQWHIDDLVWFRGHETARKPPFPFTLTFILLNKNFKYKSKFIGFCMAFPENNLRAQWLNAILSSQQGFQEKSIYPLVSV